MAAPPVPYRAKSNNQIFTPSFPPPIYYRDTFGLEPAQEHLAQDDSAPETEDDESSSTKSTVRNQINIFHPNSSVPAPSTLARFFANQPRRKSGFSAASNRATVQDSQHSQLSSTLQSQAEHLTTDQVLLIFHGQLFLWLSTVLFGVALQMLVFSTVCVFFDGHWFALCICIFLLINASFLLLFARHNHTRLMMYLCVFLSALGFFLSLQLFVLCAVFIHGEDLRLQNTEDIYVSVLEYDEHQLESNRIVQIARMTMLSLLLLFSPICTICVFACLYILLRNLRANQKGRIHKGFYLSQMAGHQKVLVPIKLRQVGRIGKATEEGTQS